MPETGATSAVRVPFRDAPRAPLRDAQGRLRRLALDRQGLLKRSPFGRGLAGTRRAIEALGYVQIDTISVVSRAHDHVLQSRVPGYQPDLLHRLQAEGSIFEYWFHAAAYLPLRDYRFARPRMNAMRARQVRWVRSHDDKLMSRVLDRVRLDGPLQARAFEAPPGRNSGWWDWKPAKQALEQLFMQGDLMVVRRDAFQKVYDLTERVLPTAVDTREPTVDEFAEHLIDRHLAAHGCASAAWCAYQQGIGGLRDAVVRALEQRRRRGELTALEPSGGRGRDPLFVDLDVLAGRAPPAPPRARLLSPFDNVVIHRQRLSRLFGFDYQIECYVPAPKRRFGYYCLPILFGDRLVGRADCKAHRVSGELEVRHLFVEYPQRLPKDREAAAAALANAVADLAGHTGCASWRLEQVTPKAWRRPLTAALAGASGVGSGAGAAATAPPAPAKARQRS